MKRFITAVFITMLLGVYSNATEFTVTGFIFNYDGTSGTASTPNSFAYFYAYRLGVAGQIAEHINSEQIPPCVSPNKVFAADGSTAAYCSTDVGSSAWDVAPVPIAAGQETRVILEVSSTGNCYTGTEAYVSCVDKTILAAEITAKGMVLPVCGLKLLPAPAIAQEGMTFINISWTGIGLDNIEGYNIYRDEDGNGNYVLISNVPQNKGNLIVYLDNNASLAQGKTYTYKISVRFIWGGGNGAPDYYETAVKSRSSAGAHLLPPTFTITPTGMVSIYSPTWTQTITATSTYTCTMTLTDTPTYTQTSTDTFTATYTATETVTQTFSFTMTLTVTVTPTITVTWTRTATPAATATATIVPALVRERVIVFNNPVRDSRVKLAFLAGGPGPAELDFYNINAELVKKYKINAVGGANEFEADFRGIAPGVYILRINVNGRNLPDRKVAVIK